MNLFLQRKNLCVRLVLFHYLFSLNGLVFQVIEVDSRWIVEIAPHFYKQNDLLLEDKKKMPKSMGKSRQDLER